MAEENSTPVLTAEQAKLIVETWALVKDIGLEEAGIIMFKRLFELAPDLINLFPFELNEDSQDGLKKHALQVMQSIDMAICMLDDQNELEDTLTDLGIIHNMKSVQVESFAPVGQALIYTLETGLQEKFTEKVKDAWITLYTIVQHFMTLGMEEGLDA